MTIDGKNIYNEYGCTLLEGSFDSLLKYPKRTTVKYNNWAEADGIDPDLSDVRFESRTIQLTFLLEADNQEDFWFRYRKLIADLSFPGYRTFDVIPGIAHRLRFKANPTYQMPVPFNVGHTLSSFSLDFVEDDLPFQMVSVPTNGISLRGQYAINGIDFGAFGIGADNEEDELLKYPAVKEPFTDGQTVDLSTIKLQHKTFTLSLWMHAASVGEFINNYQAFFHQFSAPGMQELYIKSLGGIIQAYYADCLSFSVEIWQVNQVAVRFAISLVAPVVSWVDAGGDTRYRVLKDKDLGVLADEEGRIIVFN